MGWIMGDDGVRRCPPLPSSSSRGRQDRDLRGVRSALRHSERGLA